MFANISTVWHLVPFALLWGTGFGMSVPLRLALLGDYFGRRHFGAIMGASMAMSMVSGLAAPVFVGWMVDVTESYRLPYLVLTAAMTLGVPLIATTKRPTARRTSQPAMTGN
jgi:MFS family permease